MPYTKTQVINLATKRTERRAEQELDLSAEFWGVLGEFVLEKRFPWRKKSVRILTQVGVQAYDLSSMSNPALAPDFYEARTVYRVDSPQAITEMAPILDEDNQTYALEAGANGQNAQPNTYFFQTATTNKGDNFQTLYLGANADGVYAVRLNYWAAPDPNLDSTSDTIPLVPPQLHWGLPIAMERFILRYLYGQNDPRSEKADERYEQFVLKAMKMGGYTTNRMLSWENQDTAIRAVDGGTSGLGQSNQRPSRSD